MDFKLTNRIFAAFVFLFATIVYVITVQPTFSFWDCGEFIACAFTLSVPHPPGAPFFTLMGKIFTMFPSAADIGLRVNYLSVISSSLCVLLLYLISTKVIKNWRGTPKNFFDILLICGSSAVGALSYAFSDSFWFNALEGEVYGMGTFLIGLSMYSLMVWWERADEPGSDKYLLLVAYIVGLSIGIHLLVVQCIFLAGLFFYFKRYEYSPKTLIYAIILSSIAFFIVYPGIVKKFPSLMSGSFMIGILVLGVIVFGIYYARVKKNPILSLLTLSLFLIILGYSTYISILERANVTNLPINENSPSNVETLLSYLNREQYGQQPLVMPRRYSQEPQHQGIYSKYSSDFEFMWKYQINHMFNRYWFWNYIGRAGYNQNDGVDFSKFYAIPFLIGMFGLFYQFRKDWKMAFIFLMMFLMMGIITALYQNQQEPQPRERDYFYVGAFMAFSLWIGVGVAGLIEVISEKLNKKSFVALCAAVVIVSFAAVPLNMLRVNYHYQSRNGNFLPYDYAYNILQSLDKDAILITNGDNDTFPLWCLQAVYGVRTDVRIINLSLAQTDWYNLQLKNERPYGAMTVPMTLTDAQLKRLQPVQWDEKKPVTFEVPLTAYPDSMRSKPNLPTKIVTNIPPTIRQQSGSQVITALKANDLLLIDIVKANKWERPFYFSITVTEDNYIGLSDYLVMEGMAQRLVPYKTSDGLGNEGMNVEVMRKCLLDNPSEPSQSPKYGFRFRGLNDKSIFYNEDQTRMAQTYRTVFLRLAYNYANDSAGYPEAGKILDRMETDIPRDVISMDYRIEYDVAMLYNKIGNKAKFESMSGDIEDKAENELKSNPGNMQSYYNPYRIMLDLYEAKGEYQKALDLLNRISVMNPGDASIKQKIESIKQKMNNPPK